MIKFTNINLLDTDANYICHQVNCQGKMNSGVAKAIRERWPVVYITYKAYYDQNTKNGCNTLLGDILIVNLNDYKLKSGCTESPLIINMFGQFDYGYNGQRYTSYDGFDNCLQGIKEAVPKGSKIAFPYKIGCDRGGADWEVIFAMIKSYLDEDYNIEFCYLEPDNWLKENVVDIEWRDK